MKNCRIIALLAAICILLSGCNAVVSPKDSEKHQKQVYAMDTVMILSAYGENGEAALDAAAERILALEADLNPENEGSGIWSVNHDTGNWVTVSADCIAIAEATAAVSAETGGVLAPELYNIINLWGFITDDYRVPEQWELDEALAQLRGFVLEIDEASSALRIPAGTSISFGAVAKGYTAQEALKTMAENGCENAIVSLGGNVQTMGQKPNGESWNVAIMDPDDTGDYIAMVAVGEKAVVTSGDYQRYFVDPDSGETYMHILDPKTGYPADSGLHSVTIVCDDGARADALSTAMFVLGEDAALDFQKQDGGFEMVLVTTDGRIVVTAGLRDAFTEYSEDYRYEYVE